MRKTILAISIVAAMASGNALAISNEDLLDIDNILNIDTKEKKETTKKETVETKKSTTKEDVKKDTKVSDIKQDTKNNQKSVSSIEELITEPVAPVIERKPLIPVPITGQNIALKIDVVKDKLIKSKVGSNEIIISELDKIDPKFVEEQEIKEVTSKIESFSAVSMYQEDKDMMVGVNQFVNYGFKKEVLSDNKVGFSYFVNLLEVDKRLNRAKLRIDINVSDILSYNESKILLEDGSYQKIKVPDIITTNNSKVFWVNLQAGEKISYKIDDIHSINIQVQRVVPFINQVFVVDHDKIKRLEEEKKQAEIAKVEEEKQDKIDEENEMFDSLEKTLNEQ